MIHGRYMSSLKRHMPNPRWWPSRPVPRALAAVATYLVILGAAHVMTALGIAEWAAWLILLAVLGFWAFMANMVPEIRRLRRETAARRNANEAAGLRE